MTAELYYQQALNHRRLSCYCSLLCLCSTGPHLEMIYEDACGQCSLNTQHLFLLFIIHHSDSVYSVSAEYPEVSTQVWLLSR